MHKGAIRLAIHQPIIETRCTLALYFPEPADYLLHLEHDALMWEDLSETHIPAEMVTAHSQLGYAGAQTSIDMGWAFDMLPILGLETAHVSSYVN